ncbi:MULTISPECIES: hypothetical protein [Burkholderia]|uniref:Uncharacterized protein n=1 Tax=Burkholderia anthina TaxID=179879 RepID=A0A7T7AIP5_9BURK|nr:MULTISPECIES: hypothetical protein [Burkholderia]MBY4870734.1 hypothetical protein [Burkholderia anthina]QQK03857.1 hypothetical protein JFN94_06760 [Burkholderia anthina]
MSDVLSISPAWCWIDSEPYRIEAHLSLTVRLSPAWLTPGTLASKN